MQEFTSCIRSSRSWVDWLSPCCMASFFCSFRWEIMVFISLGSTVLRFRPSSSSPMISSISVSFFSECWVFIGNETNGWWMGLWSVEYTLCFPCLRLRSFVRVWILNGCVARTVPFFWMIMGLIILEEVLPYLSTEMSLNMNKHE